ncbi:MAG: hypothetical protein JRH20_19490 [Deltaproteobacteria bacterium]|nr:hypothetical protein [Deltaproteobacteria bacterium]
MSPQKTMLTLLLSSLICSGCYFSSKPPRRFYLASEVDFSKAVYYVPPAKTGKLPTPPQIMVVMPRWTNAVTNPVGGLYDHTVSSISPLQATFFHPNISLPIWESCSHRLRGYGLKVFKDYGDVGNPSLVMKPAKEQNALLLRGTLVKLAHDQQLERVKAPGYEAVRAQIAFDLLDAHGKRIWTKTIDVFSKKTHTAPHDLLQGLGHGLADALIRDGSLVRVLASLTPTTTTQTLEAEQKGGRR